MAHHGGVSLYVSVSVLCCVVCDMRQGTISYCTIVEENRTETMAMTPNRLNLGCFKTRFNPKRKVLARAQEVSVSRLNESSNNRLLK